MNTLEFIIITTVILIPAMSAAMYTNLNIPDCDSLEEIDQIGDCWNKFAEDGIFRIIIGGMLSIGILFAITIVKMLSEPKNSKNNELGGTN